MSDNAKSSNINKLILENSENKLYDLYRRPGIITGPNGRVIVYYEGHNTEEKSQTLLSRISDDNGITWSKRIVLRQGEPTHLFHNIMMIYGGDTIHCFWNVDYRQLWHMTSKDGIHWGVAEEITDLIHSAETPYEWNAFGIGSGHGVTLTSGRILLPAWFTTGGNTHRPSAFGNIYTDDQFKTIRIGTMVVSNETILNPNEGAVVELEGGEILATIRHDSDQRKRAVCTSAGGIAEWSEIVYRDDLPDPICHASMQRLGWKKDVGYDGILFCNCANADAGVLDKKAKGLIKFNWSNDARKNLTIYLSKDGGMTFPYKRKIEYKGGYSDIAVSADGTKIICIYETGWDEMCIYPKQIGVSVFTPSWISEDHIS